MLCALVRRSSTERRRLWEGGARLQHGVEGVQLGRYADYFQLVIGASPHYDLFISRLPHYVLGSGLLGRHVS